MSEGSSTFVPPADRIATCDNDGTLWCELPAPVETGLLIGKLLAVLEAALGPRPGAVGWPHDSTQPSGRG